MTPCHSYKALSPPSASSLYPPSSPPQAPTLPYLDRSSINKHTPPTTFPHQHFCPLLVRKPYADTLHQAHVSLHSCLVKFPGPSPLSFTLLSPSIIYPSFLSSPPTIWSPSSMSLSPYPAYLCFHSQGVETQINQSAARKSGVTLTRWINLTDN